MGGYRWCHKKVKKAEKPPIGLKPHKLWLEERLAENKAAQTRYVYGNIKIPHEWKAEQRSIQAELYWLNP
jgi:hypothetical protein